MPAMADTWALAIVEGLVTASVRGALVIGLAWMICRCAATLAASTRAALWWTASLALVLALVLGSVPLPAVPLPILPAPPRAHPDVPVPADTRSTTGYERPGLVAPPMDVQAGAVAITSYDAGRTVGTSLGFPWMAVLAGLWLSGLSIACGHVLVSWRRLRRLLARARPADEAVDEMARRLAGTLGLARVPLVRMSGEIVSPQIAGVWRPVVLLPDGASTWDDRDLGMALCHEFVHVKRRDLLFGWIPLLAERMFFFHPLAYVAAREYAIAREAACDAMVLRALDVEPQQYGRLLVRIGFARRQPAMVASGAASSAYALSRRLEMLNDDQRERSTKTTAWVFAMALCLALLPVRFVAAVDVPSDVAPALHATVPPAVTRALAAAVPAAPRHEPVIVAPTSVARSDQAGSQPIPPIEAPVTQEPPAGPPDARAPSSTEAAEADDSWHAEIMRRRLQEVAERTREVRASRDEAYRLMNPRDLAVPVLVQPPGRSFRAQIQALERLAVDLLYQVDPRGLPRATDPAQLEFQMRVLQEQHEVLARAQADLARTREELARHQEELARRQEALTEAQRRLAEQVEAQRPAQ